MIEQLYDIFKECFPTTLVSKEEFEKKLDFNDVEIIKISDENNDLIGYSIVRENCISLLCVKPDFQKKGYGTKLLIESEEKIRKNGFKDILLGYKSDKSSLYMGVPILNNENHKFFSKHQYDNDFTSYDVNISILSDLDVNHNDIQDYNTIITSKYPDLKILFFQLLEKIDKKIYKRYFLEKNIDFIFCRKNNKLAGICAYQVLEDENTILIYDLVSYPSFDLKSKKLMLSEIKNIQQEKSIENICIRNVSNPILYENEFNGRISQKYWRGSKLC